MVIDDASETIELVETVATSKQKSRTVSREVATILEPVRRQACTDIPEADFYTKIPSVVQHMIAVRL